MQGAGFIGLSLGGGKFFDGVSDIVYEFTDGEFDIGEDPIKKVLNKFLNFEV